jgi:hypothetical protein
MWKKFDLIIGFVGSAACSPCLEAMMERHPTWDSRFFFSTWNQSLIDKLLKQQEVLKKKGIERHVLILCDDVILTAKDDDQLAHMAMRGRHFNVSLMMCAVSYTSISKRARRSLDVLLCYSCPMQGDRKILTWEFSNNSKTADFAMQNLDENECVVFETSRKKQKLWLWKAVLLEPIMFRESKQLPSLGELRRRASRDSAAEHRSSLRQTKTCEISDRKLFQERESAAPFLDETQSSHPSPGHRNDDVNPQSEQVYSV